MTDLQKFLGIDPAVPADQRGQSFVNKIFGATPENPVELPVSSIPVRVALEKDTQITLLGGFALIGLAIVLSNYLKSK